MLYGQDAINYTNTMFFREENLEAKKWTNNWNDYDISRSVAIIYEMKDIVGFKFVIGNIQNGSVLGEKHPYL
jgi:hypothetical protein